MGCKDCVTRRRFLEVSSKGFGALALSSPLIAAAITGCDQQPLESGLGQGPSSAELANSPNNVYSIDFTKYPALATVGGSLQFTVDATSGKKTVFVTRVDQNTVETVSTICTHAGCQLNGYDPNAKDYLCNCHGSIFAADGAVQAGPAVDPLPNYVSTLTATGVDVTVP